MKKTSLFDAFTAAVSGAIALVSPRKAARFRSERAMYKRLYTAGQLTGANKRWFPLMRTADQDIRQAQRVMSARARDIAQNSPYISGAIERIGNNTVRQGIRPQFRLRKASGEMDTRKNRQIEDIFDRWARYCDVTGHDSYWQLQKLVLRHMWYDGHIFVHRVFDRSVPPGIPPLRLEVLECDYLNWAITGIQPNGNLAREGIEFDKAGRPVAYHVFKQHPGDLIFVERFGESVRIPASDMIHVYDRRRASQTRGISWLAASIMEAYDLDEYKSYERIGAKLAAAFGIFIKSTYPDIASGLGVPAGDASDSASIPDYIEPGRIQTLPPGTDISIASHNRPGTQYEPYVRDTLRSLSVGAGMSYEAFSNDYTSASYSSSRAAALEERLTYSGQQFFLNEKFNNHIVRWFMDALYISGLGPAMPGYSQDPARYHESVWWQNPGWTWVDPLKDGRAVELKVGLGITTRREAAAQEGEDWDEVIDGLIEEEKRMSDLLRLRKQNEDIMLNAVTLPQGH